MICPGRRRAAPRRPQPPRGAAHHAPAGSVGARFHGEHHVPVERHQVLAVVGLQRGAVQAGVFGNEQRAARHVDRIDGLAQQVDAAGTLEVGLRLRPAQVHQPGRQAAHAHPGRQRLRLQGYAVGQRQLADGVGEIVRIQVVHLLVQHVHHAAAASRGLARLRQRRRQRVGQQQGRDGVGRQVLHQAFSPRRQSLVRFKNRSIVDDALRQSAAGRTGLMQQRGGRVGRVQVGVQQLALPAQGLDLGLQRAGRVGGMAVVRQHAPAGAREGQADLAPQPARRAGDQHGAGVGR